MRRFLLLLRNEARLFRTAVPIHIVAIIQPTVMYLLLTTILVHPTLDVVVARPSSDLGRDLVAALEEVGSPIGRPYVRVVEIDSLGAAVARQAVAVVERDGVPTALQRYGLIDSNLVKNFRNRLTAAALRLWNAELGPHAVTIEQHPWLPRDVPYSVYFGMAMMPMAAILAAAGIGAVLTAQEFEFRTVVEYRLAPSPIREILAGRLVRLALSGLLAATILCLAIGAVNDAWPGSICLTWLILLPPAIAAGCLGTLAGLVLRKSVPSFMVALVASFVGWIMGSAFGLAAGFGTAYQAISRLLPVTHAAELLFPLYFGTTVGSPGASALALALMAGGMLALTALVYRRVIRVQEDA